MNVSFFFNNIFHGISYISSSEFTLNPVIEVDDYCSASDEEFSIRVLVQDLAGNEFEQSLTLPVENAPQPPDSTFLGGLILGLSFIGGSAGLIILMTMIIKRNRKTI